MIFIQPFISNMQHIISTSLQVGSFKTEQTLTRGNVPVNVDAVMYFLPFDLQKVILNVENYTAARSANHSQRNYLSEARHSMIASTRERISVNPQKRS
ncbi:MAG: SPFH domain-containing protein [Nitrososphaerales archaeon]